MPYSSDNGKTEIRRAMLQISLYNDLDAGVGSGICVKMFSVSMALG